MIVVLMGVTGTGKTTVGQLLADQTGWKFYDADNYHPEANVAKMRAGTPLTDADRWPWLDKLNAILRSESGSAILACSALKHAYRQRLAHGLKDVRFVWLKGDKRLIGERLAQRKGHYMNPTLLDSQFATLEAPSDAVAVDIAATPEQIADVICEKLSITN